MAFWETSGRSNEWFTPAYIFDALDCVFDLDVASPPRPTHVPCRARISDGSLSAGWSGFIWMNPPFGDRNGLDPWLDKFFAHGDGIALTPDRTSAQWWQRAAARSDTILFVSGKIRFERPDGSVGKSPSTGTTLMAVGSRGSEALFRAAGFGLGLVLTQQGELFASEAA